MISPAKSNEMTTIATSKRFFGSWTPHVEHGKIVSLNLTLMLKTDDEVNQVIEYLKRLRDN